MKSSTDTHAEYFKTNFIMNYLVLLVFVNIIFNIENYIEIHPENVLTFIFSNNSIEKKN